MIVVFDTNVWISAMLTASRRGTPAKALEEVGARHTIAFCDPIQDEILRVLTSKFTWQAERVFASLRPFLEFAIRVPISGNFRVCRDPNDDMILECAVSAKAQIIVSGDKDLLVLGSYQGIRILTPAEFLSLVPPQV